MRTYPLNSPEAAGRIVALAALADGHVCKAEQEALHAPDTLRAIGLPRARMEELLHEVCEDLLATGSPTWPADPLLPVRAIGPLLTEIDQAELRHAVLALCHRTVEADRVVRPEEERFLLHTQLLWQATPARAQARSIQVDGGQ